MEGGNVANANAAARPATPQINYFLWHCTEASNAVG